MMKEICKFMAGDKVTLSDQGLKFFEKRKFPVQIGAIYANILGQNTEVVSHEANYVRIRMLKVKFPATCERENNFGVRIEHLQLFQGDK